MRGVSRGKARLGNKKKIVFITYNSYNMAPRWHVSKRQLELLVEFVEANRDIALKRGLAGPLFHQRAEKAWEDCARKLNGVDDGLIKMGGQWKRYWHMYKSRTKARAAIMQRFLNGTSNGNKVQPLTELEERVMAVISSKTDKSLTELEGVVAPIDSKTTGETLPVRIPLNLSDEDSEQPAPELFIQREEEQEIFFVVPKYDIKHVRESSLLAGAATPRSSREVAESSPASAAPASPGSPEQNQANHDDQPRWTMTERRMQVDEKIANALAGIDHSIRHMGVTQDRMADALERTSNLLLQLLQRLPPPS